MQAVVVFIISMKLSLQVVIIITANDICMDEVTNCPLGGPTPL
jgi:hypothetical protein